MCLFPGEHLVVMVKGDPKFPHATYKCDMCDCYFNDEFAKKAHVKGRRHRLNYKKMYQPSLYVEPTKSMVRTKLARFSVGWERDRSEIMDNKGSYYFGWRVIKKSRRDVTSPTPYLKPYLHFS